MSAYITSISGELVAEAENGIKVWLSDAGIDGFGFGETVELDYEPNDMWELVDQLSNK